MGGQSIITLEYTKGSIELSSSFESARDIKVQSGVDNNSGDTIPKGGRPIDGPAAAIKHI